MHRVLLAAGFALSLFASVAWADPSPGDGVYTATLPPGTDAGAVTAFADRVHHQIDQGEATVVVFTARNALDAEHVRQVGHVGYDHGVALYRLRFTLEFPTPPGDAELPPELLQRLRAHAERGAEAYLRSTFAAWAPLPGKEKVVQPPTVVSRRLSPPVQTSSRLEIACEVFFLGLDQEQPFQPPHLGRDVVSQSIEKVAVIEASRIVVPSPDKPAAEVTNPAQPRRGIADVFRTLR